MVIFQGKIVLNIVEPPVKAVFFFRFTEQCKNLHFRAISRRKMFITLQLMWFVDVICSLSVQTSSSSSFLVLCCCLSVSPLVLSDIHTLSPYSRILSSKCIFLSSTLVKSLYPCQESQLHSNCFSSGWFQTIMTHNKHKSPGIKNSPLHFCHRTRFFSAVL